MAITTIRSTYALDVETVEALERIAQRWRVSKSEAMRRAIRAAEAQEPAAASEALQALDRLQRRLRLAPGRAKAWARSVREERRMASARRETRSR